MTSKLPLAIAAFAGLAISAPAHAQLSGTYGNQSQPGQAAPAPMMQSQSGVTVFEGGELPATVGDNALTFTDSGDHTITSHGRHYRQGFDLGPMNDSGN